MNSPDRFLMEQRELVKKIKREQLDHHACRPVPNAQRVRHAIDVRRLCTLVTALDNWLKDGHGLETLPRAWRPRVVGPRGRS